MEWTGNKRYAGDRAFERRNGRIFQQRSPHSAEEKDKDARVHPFARPTTVHYRALTANGAIV